jgi:hypothetical protein
VKSITYAEQSWLVGDEVSDALVDYAVLLARTNSADSIDMNALSTKGEPKVLTLVIGPATMMTLASADDSNPEPDNTDALVIMRERMRIIQSPPVTLPSGSGLGEVSWEDLA